MIRITAFVRPHKLEEVKTHVANLGISGMSVSDVRGCGNSPERAGTFAGQVVLVALPVKSKIMVVAPDELREPIIEAIMETARTGEPGDGKIFVERVSDAIRIRTLERGSAGL
ncbi:MAG: P-II family nitrogen regulator [Fimbriimonadaceae bacterium]|nr:P-II family nitrogen regulator [Fimbriimonadaceae bacterium]